VKKILLKPNFETDLNKPIVYNAEEIEFKDDCLEFFDTRSHLKRKIPIHRLIEIQEDKP